MAFVHVATRRLTLHTITLPIMVIGPTIRWWGASPSSHRCNCNADAWCSSLYNDHFVNMYVFPDSTSTFHPASACITLPVFIFCRSRGAARLFLKWWYRNVADVELVWNSTRNLIIRTDVLRRREHSQPYHILFSLCHHYYFYCLVSSSITS